MSPWWLTTTGGVTGNYVECLAGMHVTQVESLFSNWLKNFFLSHRLDVEQSSPPAISLADWTVQEELWGWVGAAVVVLFAIDAVHNAGKWLHVDWLVGWITDWLADLADGT